ncbi:DUF1120 domain-containing protein [Erwinia sp. HR93]|uniref:DUF1120 domain-containing protein n=1 Tax=Erwinia sp. HR93 TaxID=3094840 RepID=UPI002ADEE58C|nr:DUF1120 domain-containing protein [Erwinia sp. HR93]MEA1063623.1 DUF1120 domain-containing protein [Erwinia sp. HR93]
MKRIYFPLAILAAALNINSAVAADSVDVKVIGTIVPVACTPSLLGGGTFDYGTIVTSTLSPDSYTTLPEKRLDFSITCEAPTFVGLRVSDAQASSAVAMPKTLNFTFNRGATANLINGLGLTSEGKLIGNYQAILNTTKAIIDGQPHPLNTLISKDSGGSWSDLELVTNLSGPWVAGNKPSFHGGAPKVAEIRRLNSPPFQHRWRCRQILIKYPSWVTSARQFT